MTLVLVGKGLVLRGWPSKIDVFGAPDTSTHRLPFRWEDFVFYFLLTSKKSSIWTGFAGFTSLFFYITLKGVSNDIFHPHVFSDVEEGHLWNITYLYIYKYTYVYIYIFILKTLFEWWLAKQTILQNDRKKAAKSVPPSPKKKTILSITSGAVAETLFQGGQSRISGGPPVAKSLVWGKWSRAGVIQLLMAEILRQLRWSISQYLHGFIHPKWCGISSINSRSPSKIWSRIVGSISNLSGCKEF